MDNFAYEKQHYTKDIARLKEAFAQDGIGECIAEDDLIAAYLDYSDAMSATWLIVDSDLRCFRSWLLNTYIHSQKERSPE